MVEGLGKGAGLALLAVPMADAFIFSQAQCQRILSNYLGMEGAISIPHTHHCGGGAARVLTEGTVNHLQVCPELGRNSTPDDVVREMCFRTWWCKMAGCCDMKSLSAPFARP